MKESLNSTAPGHRLELDHYRGPVGQLSFDDLGLPLENVTFVVVDLETTGGKPELHSITEFGAVKVRGGELVGEFATLVNPGVPIPPFITVLTGITTAMTIEAPDISAVMPAFLEFLGSDPKFTQEGFKGGVGGGEHGEGAFGLQGFNQLSLGKGGDKDAEIGI